MEEMEESAENCTIVVKTGGVEVGLTVDKVSEVLDIVGNDIEPVPSFGSDVCTEYLLGIGNTNGRVRLLLNIDRILSDQEDAAVHGIQEEHATVG